MPISYMASNGKGHYLQKRIPKDLLHHYPECRSGIIKRYLHKAPASRCKISPALTCLKVPFEVLAQALRAAGWHGDARGLKSLITIP
jgi:hypothetical protein